MSSTKINIARLEKLATHLESGKLGHEKFDFGAVNDNVPLIAPRGKVKGCGTLGCAMGELPIVFRRHWEFQDPVCNGEECVLPQLRKADKGWLGFEDSVKEFFGLSEAAHYHLFFPNEQATGLFGGWKLGYSATRKQVARNIRVFVKRAKEGKIDN